MRVQLKSPKGAWFDSDTAVQYCYAGYVLYHTRRGNWILTHPELPSKILTEQGAWYWLSKNWCYDPTIKTNSGEV